MPRSNYTGGSFQTDNIEIGVANSLLVLTGHRKKHRHHLVRLNGREIWLTREAFRALCDLAFGLIRTETGLCQTNRRTVLRLRREIDEAFHTPGVGRALVECCDKNRYRLTLASDEIVIETSFSELDVTHFSCIEVYRWAAGVVSMMRPEWHPDAT
jgi:hypothetical protein